MLKILAISILSLFHPVHVTLTSIDHVNGTDSLKVFIRMYYDDFLLDYSSAGLPDAGIESSVSKTFPADLMSNYLNEKVNIIVNNKHLKGKLLNLVLENNEISMNLLYITEKKPRTISVRNLIMTGIYADQSNMTIIRINDFEEGVMLTPVKNEQTFNLK